MPGDRVWLRQGVVGRGVEMPGVQGRPRRRHAECLPASWTIVVGLAVAACGGGGEPQKVRQGPLPSEDRVVRVPEGGVQMGFAIGVIREAKEVEAFVISKFPVTRGEYLACVAGGACTVSAGSRCGEIRNGHRLDRSTISDAAAPDDLPATCVGLDQAEAFCGWLGASLPSLPQWMLAARGGAPVRYPWGSGAPSCERHPLGRPLITGEPVVSAAPGGVAFPIQPTPSAAGSCLDGVELPFRVAQHAAGASPYGVQDVLLTRTELVRTSPDAVLSACSEGDVRGGACLVHGLLPGAIDAVQRLPKGSDPPELSPLPYGFRCAWSQEAFK